MARHFLSEDHLNTGASPKDRPPDRRASGPGDGPEARIVLARAQLVRGDVEMALGAARHLADLLPGRPDPLDLLVDAALEHGRVHLARSAVAQAEAEGAAPAAQAATLKARIALSEGDFPAAKAILVTAIEAASDTAALRAVLAEVMVAAGTAADARAVLTHLGQPPACTPPADSEEDGAAQRQVGKRIG